MKIKNNNTLSQIGRCINKPQICAIYLWKIMKTWKSLLEISLQHCYKELVVKINITKYLDNVSNIYTFISCLISSRLPHKLVSAIKIVLEAVSKNRYMFAKNILLNAVSIGT